MFIEKQNKFGNQNYNFFQRFLFISKNITVHIFQNIAGLNL